MHQKRQANIYPPVAYNGRLPFLSKFEVPRDLLFCVFGGRPELSTKSDENPSLAPSCTEQRRKDLGKVRPKI